eukprot:7675994-Lingulodinium_polyedra.AAC.1
MSWTRCVASSFISMTIPSSSNSGQWPDTELHLHPPVQIKDAASDAELLSFTAPWTKLLATTS